MPALESAALGLARTVASSAATLWLSHRRDRANSSGQLSDLISTQFRDRFQRRKAELQLESMASDIAERIERLFEADGSQIPNNEAVAAIEVVSRTLRNPALTDKVLFVNDADPSTLLLSLRPTLNANITSAGLSEASTRMAEIVLQDCVRCYVELVRHLPEFNNRANQEILARLSQMSTDLSVLLSMMPPLQSTESNRSEDPQITLDRYTQFISAHYDQLGLFGVDVRNFSPETTLSIAYLNLAVTGPDTNTQAVLSRQRPSNRSFLNGLKGTYDDDTTGLRVESALSKSNRILIRGEAGSGKSTLLRWLAINAARREFTGNLSAWNGKVPFLVKLRSYADRALPVVGNQLGEDIASFGADLPSGCVNRLFAEGRAILLVDGVDELVKNQRAAVRSWLRKILDQYPDVVAVVTSRPTAAPARWLTNEGFTALMLERMTPTDIAEFVYRWHRAIRGARHLPCDVDELPRYERRLLARLDANHHLRGLATNPLMCAMLCALNLDRTDDLPHDRLSLYRAALEMLLERRDAARSVPAYRRIALGGQHSMSLLQDLAWRFSIAGHAELDIDHAKSHVRRKLTTMPKVEASTDDVFEHLLDRSGVLKDIAEDRISFVHRTFQEYLTAKEVSEENYIDMLLQHASRDMWRETVIMTAGHASTEYRHRLINGLLDRAEKASQKQARWLRLLAAACIETSPALAPDILARIDNHLALLVPPRSVIEARSLALAGERVIDLLPDDISLLSNNAARAAVETVSYVGGPKALRKLARYGTDDRSSTIGALLEAANNFEPEEYARTVLADSPLHDGFVNVNDWTSSMLPHLRQLTGVRALVEDLDALLKLLPPVRRLDVMNRRMSRGGRALDLSGLAGRNDLEELLVESYVRAETLPESLTALKRLRLWQVHSDASKMDLNWLAKFPQLTTLQLGEFIGARSMNPLLQIAALSSLTLNARLDRKPFGKVEFISRLPHLDSLGINGCSDEDVLSIVATAQPKLTNLQLMRLNVRSIDLNHVTRLPLKHLDIDSCTAHVDLLPLANLQTLETLDIRGCMSVGDLSPLAALPNLSSIYLYGVPDLDLSPLAGMGHLTVWAYSSQVRNAAGVRVRGY
ncbi:NACHT domain-containing protein [Catellatospora aurea]|uniref:NACHT domain-containing protein n=1 Tax=Catellatospora aurea TaxID=1337874 RepID=A0ABW2GQX9_9ACTN